MAPTVALLSTALAIMAGPDGVDPSCHPVTIGQPRAVRPEGLRVGVVEGEDPYRPAESTRKAVLRAVEILVALGARVIEGVVPQHLDESLDITERYWRSSLLSGADVDRQLRDWDRFAGVMTRALAHFDVVIGPVVADVAPLRRLLTGTDYLFTLPWSLTGWPAASVPAGFDANTGLALPCKCRRRAGVTMSCSPSPGG